MNWIYEILRGPRGEPLETFAARIGHEVERLIRTEERFNLAVRLSRVAVFRIGRNLRYDWSFNSQFGSQEDSQEIVGKGNHDLFEPDDAALLDGLYLEAFGTGQPQTVDVRLRCLQSGCSCHLEILVEPVRGEDGQIEALTGAALDLSPEVERHREISLARREAEAARQQAVKARADAEHANLIKTRFMTAAGHDLRQPLQAMRLFQNAVANRFRATEDEEGLKAAEAIGRAISSAEELLNSLMDLATLESGVLEARLTDIPVNEIVDGNVSDFKSMAERKGLRLLVHPSSRLIHSDPVLLKRIIRNLTINAIKYTHQGGVLVGCRQRHGSLRIEVWDTGTGIPEDKLDHIFEEFYRGDEAADAGGGLGIGLAIVTRMARLLNCEVTVRSRVGKGSLFAITVPLAQPRPDVPMN